MTTNFKLKSASYPTVAPSVKLDWLLQPLRTEKQGMFLNFPWALMQPAGTCGVESVFVYWRESDARFTFQLIPMVLNEGEVRTFPHHIWWTRTFFFLGTVLSQTVSYLSVECRCMLKWITSTVTYKWNELQNCLWFLNKCILCIQ